MTLASITALRRSLWCEGLVDFGWEVIVVEDKRPTGLVAVSARRPVFTGPPIALFVREEWVRGADPDGLGLDAHGCFLRRSSWHAQVHAYPRAECAYRLDVDRAKIGGLRIHLHPFGQPNDVRLPRSNLGTPEQWLVEIEELYYVWYG